MMRVEVKPEVLRWAWECSGRSAASLRKRFPGIDLWERGEAMPTFEQLEAFAEAVFVPKDSCGMHPFDITSTAELSGQRP